MVYDRIKMYHFAVDLFVSVLSKKTKRIVNYRCSDADLDCWNKFCDTYHNEICEKFVKDFATYVMKKKLYNVVGNDYGYRMRFSWVFGKSGIDLWNKEKKWKRGFIGGILRSECKVPIKIQTKLNDVVLDIRVCEEKYKEEYLNTPRGFSWCIANTTLYHHRSINCTICKNKIDCKRMLKEQYPIIYKKRGYE